jgi:hypothetical protein|tara:strand:- start:356 stop:697 length:342 start_codon:yes stop_codon:yes gene_type:complete
MKSLKNLEVLDIKTDKEMPVNNSIEYNTVENMVVKAYDLFLEIQELYKQEVNKTYGIEGNSDIPGEGEYFHYQDNVWKCVEIRLPLHVLAYREGHESNEVLIPITKIDFINPF